jgi:hypothetical protein
MAIEPGAAAVCMREARLAVWPIRRVFGLAAGLDRTHDDIASVDTNPNDLSKSGCDKTVPARGFQDRGQRLVITPGH